MASSYVPTNVTTGFGSETLINKNFSEISTALNEMLSRVDSVNNAQAQQLDMGGFQIINLPVAVDSTDPVLFSQVNSLAIKEVVQDITFSTEISIDINTTTFAKITLTGNTTITFTGTPNDGQPILLALRQDAIGSRTVTWGTRARFSTDVPLPVLSTAASALDYLVFRYNEDDNKFDLMGINRGF